MLEDRRIYGSHELDSGRMALNPADAGLDRIVAVELHPDGLVEARPLDELELAAFRRDVENVHQIMMMAAPAKLHFRPKRNARAFPMPLTSARVILFHATDTLERDTRGLQAIR